jgi:N-sulfoglucosamine sulfohydrolase
MFLSDNGMALPFSKTNCYLHSTRTPWIAAWPGRIKPGIVDKQHFISGIDFMPTALDAAGVSAPGGMDGSSFLPVLLGKRQPERDKVFTQFHQTSGSNRFPMRCVQNNRFGYIFNPWSDGKRIFRNESQSGLTFNAMKTAAQKDDSVAARVKLFQYRVVEEFYDFKNDPDGLHNLIDDPNYKEEIDKSQKELHDWMKKTGDTALAAFENRTSPEALKDFMAEQDARAGQKQQKKKASKTGSRKQRSG